MDSGKNRDVRELIAWISDHTGAVAILLIALGAAVRVFYAWACYLNPDEVMHYDAAALPTWWLAYERSTYQAHPPLLVLMQHGLLSLFGDYEVLLRLPSLLLGVASMVLVFRWVDLAIGRTAALAALLFVVCAPPMVSAATEFRHTALILFFTCAALYSCERLMRSAVETVTRAPMRWLALLHLSLAGALLSHYSGAWVVATFGVYVGWRFWRAGVARALWIAWLIGQLGLLSLALWAFFIHGAMYAKDVNVGGAGIDYLRARYFQPARESALDFLWRNGASLWNYLAGDGSIGLAAFCAWAVGLVVLACGQVGRRDLALLLGLPFLIAASVGALRLYPFGGVRHVSYLLPFAAAATGAAFDWVLQRRQGVMACLCLGLAPLWLATTEPANAPRHMSRRHLTELLDYIDKRVPAHEPVFVDHQTQRVLLYYHRTRTDRDRRTIGDLYESQIGARRFVEPAKTWAFRSGELLPTIVPAASSLGYRNGDAIWVLSLGWDVVPPMGAATPAVLKLSERSFGNARLLQLRLPPRREPGRRRPQRSQ